MQEADRYGARPAIPWTVRPIKLGYPRVSGIRVLWALVLTVVVLPFLDRTVIGQVIESVLLTTVLCGAVFAVGAHRRTMLRALALAAPALVGKWIHTFRPGWMPPAVFLVGAILCVLYVTYHFLRFVMRATRADGDVLCTGVAAFLLIAFLWALAYALVEACQPGSFVSSVGGDPEKNLRGFTALYFSVVTLCTVGFGDIVPVSGPARMLAMLESMVGVFFIAVMVARLVSMYSNQVRSTSGDPASP